MDDFNEKINTENNELNEQTPETDGFEKGELPNDVDSATDTENDNNVADETGDANNIVENGPPVWNKVSYKEPAPIADYKPMSRGMKIFCVIIAAVILLTASCTTGYFIGRGSVSNNYVGAKVDVDLAAKPADENQSTTSKIYDKVNKSIVGIRVYNDAGSVSDASGVIYTKDGYIVTNDHIYAEVGAPKFKVFMYDGTTEYDATYVAGDSVSDLAVLKIDVDDLDVAEFGNSGELINGESVVAIGRPNDATDYSSITSGIISLTKRRVKTTSNYTASLIQTDSAINPGSSGGALVNMYGQVVGITSSKLAGVEYDSIGFAIPTTTMKRVVEQLITDGKVTDRAKLGITYTEINSVTAEIQKLSETGLKIVSVSQDSDIYGKVNEGDIITHVNGIKITNDDIVLDIIEECKAGDKISLTVLKSNGTSEDYDVKLKANISDSSYSSVIKSESEDNSSGSGSSSGGTFDFPYGE